MMQPVRMVEAKTWTLSDAVSGRRERLHDVPHPSVMIAMVASEAGIASKGSCIQPTWEESLCKPGYFRAVAQIPLEEVTFDQLFNGRSGYRAQYYLSPEEGILFNRELIYALIPALRHAYRLRPLPTDWDLMQLSLETRHSKIWVFEDKVAFDDSIKETLNPKRWVANDACRGRRVPLPAHRKIDVKGAFIEPSTLDLYIDECKEDRACVLFNKGFS